MTPEARAERVIRDAIVRHGGRVAVACSFGGPSGMALLDLVQRIDRTLPVYYIDTGLLFPETYALVARAGRRYGIAPVALQPALTVAEQDARYGAALWERDPDACCALRKVAPHRAFLRGYGAWLTAIRRDQSATRAEIEPVADDGAGLVKVSPLFDWSEADVWAYVNAHDVPVNPLLADGYPSLGCIPCTRRASADDPRAGRWTGFAKTECGLHHAPAGRAS
ncbi:MAG: phosphoadenylyl-sulfate reductase [Candidatus Eremiobacteraeota bacterium]|nr:phosphoadenylyl-sulfate reductase [Candidatus Eremiobacteraeota bacterium]